MLRKKYVTLTLHDISSLPKINHRELEIICTVLLLELGKAGEIIISHLKKTIKKKEFLLRIF